MSTLVTNTAVGTRTCSHSAKPTASEALRWFDEETKKVDNSTLPRQLKKGNDDKYERQTNSAVRWRNNSRQKSAYRLGNTRLATTKRDLEHENKKTVKQDCEQHVPVARLQKRRTPNRKKTKRFSSKAN